jgi:hypothetical protein
MNTRHPILTCDTNDSVRDLRRIRAESLKIAAACGRWQGHGSAISGLLEQSGAATACLARAVTGSLTTHPSSGPNPEAGAAELEPRAGFALHASVSAIALTHRSDSARLRWLYRQMSVLQRHIARARAATTSALVEDLLSRNQPDARTLDAILLVRALMGEPVGVSR